MFLRTLISAALLAGLVFSGSTVLAEEVRQVAKTDQKEPATLRELIDASLEWYEVFASAESEEPAEPKVALRWANNARGSEDGTTVLFVAGGRPLAVACIYPWDGRLEHEFESLSRGKVVARKDGTVVWQPQTAGIKFAAIPGAPLPDESRPQRLRQMKVLAEQFQATMCGWKADSTDREELRLLTKPLYRYDPPQGPVIDGAVFAFVMGTDPEVLLLIEAVKQGETAAWQFAFARRTSGELEGRWKEGVVWQAGRNPTQRDPQLPHFTIGTPLPPEIRALEAKLEKKQP